MSTQNMSELATRQQAGHILGSVENQLLALPRETAQLIITPHLALYQARHQQMLDELVGDITNTIIVRVKIKRGRNGRQLFKDTGRVQYVTGSVADSAPLIGGDVEEEVEYHFFNPGRRMSDAEVELERKKRGLVRDLEVQCQYNQDHPEFADEHRNGDSWQDANGNWCYASFGRNLDGERCVSVRQSGLGWPPGVWFGGAVSKLPLAA